MEDRISRLLYGIVCGVVICDLGLGIAVSAWSYTANGLDGPNNWCRLLPHTMCCGNMQSPIDVNARYAMQLRMPDLWMRNYDVQLLNVSLTNNGHTVMVHTTRKKRVPMLSGGPLKGTYMFNNLHFHWGSSSKTGSEHTMNGIRYPMEMHIVHINAKYPDEEEARYHYDGFAIISIMFKLTDMENRNFREIVNGLRSITSKHKRHGMSKSFNLESLMPRNARDYMAYFGSETAPPCTQTVTWIVMEHLNGIGRGQIEVFRDLRQETLEKDPAQKLHLMDNFRPLQSPDNRMVFASCPT